MDRSHLSRPPTRHAFATFYRLCRRRGRCLVVIAKGASKSICAAALRCLPPNPSIPLRRRRHFRLSQRAGCIVSDFHLGLPLPIRSFTTFRGSSTTTVLLVHVNRTT